MLLHSDHEGQFRGNDHHKGRCHQDQSQKGFHVTLEMNEDHLPPEFLSQSPSVSLHHKNTDYPQSLELSEQWVFVQKRENHHCLSEASESTLPSHYQPTMNDKENSDTMEQ